MEILYDERRKLAIPLTTYGAFQRAKIYAKEYSGDKWQKERSEFRSWTFNQLEASINTFTKISNDQDAFDYLQELNSKINSCNYNYLFKNNRFRIGNTQKLLNLYWKMIWIMEKREETPIHCPFDFIIINTLNKSVRDIKWTEFDSIDDYKKLVKAAREASGINKGPLGLWEMQLYRNLRNSTT